ISTMESLRSRNLNPLIELLRSIEERTDLNNLSEVSDHFNGEVKEFMQRENNRPGFKYVHLTKNEAGLEVKITLFYSIIAFYDLANLDMERIKISSGDDELILEVTLTGREDPLFEQLAEFLSSCINVVHIYDLWGLLSSFDLLLFAELLASSTIEDLSFLLTILDDSMTPFFMSILSKA
ncbi:hypothetical protein PMAYCL1PPCAC_27172, partial [Pristionchus mayeri]